jgi:transposase-like protein
MTKSERENWQKEMFSLINKWKGSGINQIDFCEQHDISIHAFYYWLRKYKQTQPESGSGFLPVEICPINNDIPLKGEIRILILYISDYY